MSLTIQLPQTFIDAVRALVDEDDRLYGALLGLSEDTQNAWEALRNIAHGEITDDVRMKDALACIRAERGDDCRLRQLYDAHRNFIDSAAPKRGGIGRWIGSEY